MAAFEATKALYEITCRDVGADIDVFFDCVLGRARVAAASGGSRGDRVGAGSCEYCAEASCTQSGPVQVAVGGVGPARRALL
ncbi:hypothetical protein ABT034_34785 [Streptomyces sp. NPDC002773]|uniref:hypothetical protein n=1 Tax=Streptomyces sp. NPDC002773 TaxID=3154430 RepID=UPI00331AF8EA